MIDLERGTRTQLGFPGGSEGDGVWLDDETILAERAVRRRWIARALDRRS